MESDMIKKICSIILTFVITAAVFTGCQKKDLSELPISKGENPFAGYTFRSFVKNKNGTKTGYQYNFSENGKTAEYFMYNNSLEKWIHYSTVKYTYNTESKKLYTQMEALWLNNYPFSDLLEYISCFDYKDNMNKRLYDLVYYGKLFLDYNTYSYELTDNQLILSESYSENIGYSNTDGFVYMPEDEDIRIEFFGPNSSIYTGNDEYYFVPSMVDSKFSATIYKNDENGSTITIGFLKGKYKVLNDGENLSITITSTPRELTYLNKKNYLLEGCYSSTKYKIIKKH